MKFSKKTFKDLAIKMISFGVGIGVGFPFFALLLGVDKKIALTPMFFMSCIGAGIVVGFCGYLIMKSTVGKKLIILVDKMKCVSDNINDLTEDDDEIILVDAFVKEDSQDEFGACAISFNNMVESLIDTQNIQRDHREYMQGLAKDLNIEYIGEFALKSMMSHLNAIAGAIFVENNGELNIVANQCLNGESLKNDSQMLTDVLIEGKRKIIQLPQDVIVDALLVEFTPSKLLLEPIIYNDIISGVILFAAVDDFNIEFMKYLDLFVYSFSHALKNSLQHEHIQKLAVLDSLTEIYNRRFGLQRLIEEYSRSIRTKSPLGILMMDIDKFKKVNDTYGHIAGDRVLKNLVSIVNGIIRTGDVFVRYGGEEFLLILPGANKEDAYTMGERIRYAISEIKTTFGKVDIKTTISIGVDSTSQTEVERPIDLIANADKALYTAKGTGRNKTVVYNGK